jgi:hypothetical protein
VTAGDNPRVFDVCKWRVAVHELPCGCAEGPHVDFEWIIKTTEGTSVVRDGRRQVRENAKRLTSAFLGPVRTEGSENKGKGEWWPIKGSDHAYLPVNYPNRIAALGHAGRRAYCRGKIRYKCEGEKGRK